MYFPVIASDEILTYQQFKQYVPNNFLVNLGSNNSSLLDIKGTIYGDMLVSALELDIISGSDTSQLFLQEPFSDGKGNTYYLKVGRRFYSSASPQFDLYVGGADTNLVSNNIPSYLFMQYRSDNDIIMVPTENYEIGLFYLKNDNTVLACRMRYVIGGDVYLAHDATISQRFTFLTGLSTTPINPDNGNGIFIVGKLPSDPFGPGGNSGENDTPPGTFDKTSDPIPDSPLPTLSMADTGFTRIYNPTLSQVQSLAEYMWKTENIFETLWNKVKQSFENPMDVMIAFNIVPVAVPDGGTADFSIMYIPTGVQLTKAANQFVDVDCGTLTLQGYYGSALDYSPNTSIQCFLPFIGIVELNADEVMNTTLQIKYRVDIVSGGCVAKIFIDNNCLYQYSGHCSISVPFSASDFSSYMNAMLQVSALAVGAIAAGTGAALAEGSVMGAHAIEQATNKTVKHVTQTTTERNPATGRQITTGTVTTHTETERANETTEASFNGLSPQNITNTASAIMASKAGISHAGSFNGNTGYLGVRYPFLIITTPRQCLPASFQTMNGYPSMITLSLGDCTGYTRVQQVQLTGMTATNPEQAEILQLLKEGVIL